MDDEKKTETTEEKATGPVPAPKKKVYKTSDIAIASCMILHGFTLLKLEPMSSAQKGNKKVPQNHFYFVFEDGPDREKIVMGYVGRTLKVVPADFMDNIRRLKQATKESSQ